MKGKEDWLGNWTDLGIFEIFGNAANGDIGAIVILVIAGLFLIRFLFALLKFVFKQFPALFFGTVAGIAMAEEDGVFVDEVFAQPDRLPELLPYLLPALAVAFVIWNVILFILRTIFRSIFGQVKTAMADQHNVTRRTDAAGRKTGTRQAGATETHNVTRSGAQRQRKPHKTHVENEVVTASERGAKRQREKLMQAYEKRNQRMRDYDAAHGGDHNQPMVIRRHKPGATVVRP